MFALLNLIPSLFEVFTDQLLLLYFHLLVFIPVCFHLVCSVLEEYLSMSFLPANHQGAQSRDEGRMCGSR